MATIDKKEALRIIENIRPVKVDTGDILDRYNFLEKKKSRAELEAEEKEDIIKLRRRWSNWILFCIILIAISDIAIVFFIGFNLFKFQNNYVMPAFIGESIIKIIVLAVIIVKFLFNSNSAK